MSPVIDGHKTTAIQRPRASARVLLSREPDPSRFRQGIIPRPVVADDAANHPEGAGANCGRAMDQHGPVGGIVGEAQELVRLLSWANCSGRGCPAVQN